LKIEANDKEIQDIISLGYFTIPRFQRPYSWDLEEVDSFWSDAILEDQENYFIGSMVVYQSKKPYFGIVDGQQRLTTITLILSSIRNAFISIGEENLAKGVHKYIEKPNIDNENEFVLKTESSFPFLQDHIQSFDGYELRREAGVEEQKLESAFNSINNKLRTHIPGLKFNQEIQSSLFKDHENDTVQALKVVRDKILSLKLVFIQLDNEDDAYLIFETLNARGRDLTTSDLVKNLILKQIKNTSVSIDQAKESWNKVVRNFDDTKDAGILDVFLLHYWLSEYKYTTDKRLFSEIKSQINGDGLEARSLVKKISKSAAIYIKLVSPENSTWSQEEQEVKRTLQALNLFNVKQQSSMTLALFRAYEEGKITLRNLGLILKKIEMFHFCFNAITSQRSSGSIATTYSKLAIMLTQANSNDKNQVVFNELRKFLSSRLPEEKEFLVKFGELNFTSKKTRYKKIVKYSLSMLLPKSHGGLPVDLSNLTIEHILPESASKNSSNDLMIGSIGNLILLDRKTNSEELADKPPREKFDILRSKPHPYPLESFLIHDNEWNEKAIRERTNKMGAHIYQIARSAIGKTKQ
jgi:uncharacterized protein with ParB-like and HNH nuclease domain